MSLLQRQETFRRELIEADLLVELSPGLYGRSETFEAVAEGIERLVTHRGQDQNATRIRYPAIFPRAAFELTDYVASFPDLTGAVFTFGGTDRDHAELLARRSAGEEWRNLLAPSELMLVSAACHPVYPMLAGELPDGGRRIDVLGLCFRHEPSVDPARMQAFRQREYVYAGDPDNAVAHRSDWIERGLKILRDLGLDAKPVVANDPFFGRAGRILAANQREENLKTELVVHLYGDDADGGDGTAVASCNGHLDHFGASFGIRTSDGRVAHTACVGFGLERITLALLRTHGLDVRTWPAAVRELLFSHDDRPAFARTVGDGPSHGAIAPPI